MYWFSRIGWAFSFIRIPNLWVFPILFFFCSGGISPISSIRSWWSFGFFAENGSSLCGTAWERKQDWWETGFACKSRISFKFWLTVSETHSIRKFFKSFLAINLRKIWRFTDFLAAAWSQLNFRAHRCPSKNSWPEIILTPTVLPIVKYDTKLNVFTYAWHSTIIPQMAKNAFCRCQ